MRHDLECCLRDDGSAFVFCDPWCSEAWTTEHVEADLPLPAGLPTLRALELVGCAWCAWCGKLARADEGCPLCPCPEERLFLSFVGGEVAEALFVAWRGLVGPTDDSDHLVVARLSTPIPGRAWAIAEDLLRTGGLTPERIAREALRAAGYPVPEER